MDDATGHLLLRSTPRARAKYTGSNAAAAATPTVVIALMDNRDDVVVLSGEDFGTTASINSSFSSNASSPHSGPVAPAAPFLVHVSPPCGHSVVTRLKDLLSSPDAGGYFLDKYVHVSSYLVVPRDEFSSDERALIRTLDKKINPAAGFVIALHKYEQEDKIEPFLCQ